MPTLRKSDQEFVTRMMVRICRIRTRILVSCAKYSIAEDFQNIEDVDICQSVPLPAKWSLS